MLVLMPTVLVLMAAESVAKLAVEPEDPVLMAAMEAFALEMNKELTLMRPVLEVMLVILVLMLNVFVEIEAECLVISNLLLATYYKMKVGRNAKRLMLLIFIDILAEFVEIYTVLDVIRSESVVRRPYPLISVFATRSDSIYNSVCPLSESSDTRLDSNSI